MGQQKAIRTLQEERAYLLGILLCLFDYIRIGLITLQEEKIAVI